MNVQHYEVIDNLDRTISHISRNESIDRAQALKALKERLAYQLRRIDNSLAVGWIDDFKSNEPTKKNGGVFIGGSISPGTVIVTGNGNTL